MSSTTTARARGNALPFARDALTHVELTHIEKRVFVAPVPRLLSDSDIKLAGPNDTKSAALLRISLLWDELMEKIDTTPTAALGLLDIADSRGVWNSETLDAVNGAIVIAMRSAVADMSANEAWGFVTALVRKMRRHGLERGRVALRDVAARLSISSPQGAIAFLSQPFAEKLQSDLFAAIVDGIAHAPDDAMSIALLSASPDVFGRILAASRGVARRTADDARLLDRVRVAISDFEPNLLVAVRERLLPLLIHEWQIPFAGPLIWTLDLGGLMDEIRRLEAMTGLAVPGLTKPIIDRARELDGVEPLRRLLLELPRSDGRDRTLFATLVPSISDVCWLL